MNLILTIRNVVGEECAEDLGISIQAAIEDITDDVDIDVMPEANKTGEYFIVCSNLTPAVLARIGDVFI